MGAFYTQSLLRFPGVGVVTVSTQGTPMLGVIGVHSSGDQFAAAQRVMVSHRGDGTTGTVLVTFEHRSAETGTVLIVVTALFSGGSA
jgi:hypothetical protein